MLSIEEHERVLAIRMSREILGYELARTFVYLIDGLLIDTGPPKWGDQLVKIISDHEIKLIVNTYYASENIGNNALLQRTFSVPIKAHKEAAERIRHPRQKGVVMRWLRGQPPPSKVSKLKNHLRFKDYYYKVLETPGVGPGHICLFEPERRWLFSGRLLTKKEMKSDREAKDLARDLKRVLSLEPATVFCADQGVLIDGLSAIESKLRTVELGIGNEIWDDAWSLSN
ncbi:MAG: MBL fold metallo-hydrolase [Syntrophomonadaceae bacterium]|nr:MBL fold metallo-hydrolase [Syntrophomonadaceae bacterium]